MSKKGATATVYPALNLSEGFISLHWWEMAVKSKGACENVLVGGKKLRGENYPNHFKTSSNSTFELGLKGNLLFYFNMTL